MRHRKAAVIDPTTLFVLAQQASAGKTWQEVEYLTQLLVADASKIAAKKMFDNPSKDVYKMWTDALNGS